MSLNLGKDNNSQSSSNNITITKTNYYNDKSILPIGVVKNYPADYHPEGHVNETAAVADHHQQLLDQQSQHDIGSSPFKDLVILIVTLSLLSLTLYIALYLWRKHKERPIPTLYKVQDYSYSRLNQNEIDAEGRLRCYTDTDAKNTDFQSDDDDEEFRPATIEVETDSLVTISNSTCSTIGTAASKDNNIKIKNPAHSNSNKIKDNVHQNGLFVSEGSDEDLLQ